MFIEIMHVTMYKYVSSMVPGDVVFSPDRRMHTLGKHKYSALAADASALYSIYRTMVCFDLAANSARQSLIAE